MTLCCRLGRTTSLGLPRESASNMECQPQPHCSWVHVNCHKLSCCLPEPSRKNFKGQNGQKLPGFQFWGYSPVRRNVHHEIASPRPRVSPTALHFMDEEIGEAECCSSAHLFIKPHLPRFPCATLGHPLLIWYLKELKSLSEAGTSVFSFYKEH